MSPQHEDRPSYLEMLRTSARRCGNCACMGLDPQPEVLPFQGGSIRSDLGKYFERLLGAMVNRSLKPAAFKPNLGYFSCLDRPLQGTFEGSLALADLIAAVRDLFPATPLILDAKRGDIARSSQNYAEEAFIGWQADAVTVSPFMGTDSVQPFEQCADGKRGVYVLNRTSNAGAKDLQGMTVVDTVEEKDLYPMHQAVAILISSWAAARPGTGAVVGATSVRELGEIAAWYSHKNVPMLIPGVGSQGASAKLTMEVLQSAAYDVALARINSSSALTHPWKKAPAPADWLDKCLANIAALLKETAL